MSFSKQLYITLVILFVIVFTGYLVVDIEKNKAQLENETAIQVQNSVAVLEMNLKPLIKDKYDPEIKSTLNKYINQDFCKEIRVEDSSFFIKDSDLIKNSKDLPKGKWQITNLTVSEDIGSVELFSSLSGMEFELNAIEESLNGESFAHYKKPEVEMENIYVFTPNNQYKNYENVLFSFTANDVNDKKINATSIINMNKVIAKVTKDTKFDNIPEWFMKMIPLSFEEKSIQISSDWKTKVKVYLSADTSIIYEKLYEEAKNIAIYASIIFIASFLILFILMEFIIKSSKK